MCCQSEHKPFLYIEIVTPGPQKATIPNPRLLGGVSPAFTLGPRTVLPTDGAPPDVPKPKSGPRTRKTSTAPPLSVLNKHFSGSLTKGMPFLQVEAPAPLTRCAFDQMALF